jgi:hypothetical protein
MKYTLTAHVVLYDSGKLSSYIRQKYSVTTTESNALEIVLEPDKEEIMHRILLHKEAHYRQINRNITRKRKICRDM